MFRNFLCIVSLLFIVSQTSLAQNVGIDEPNPSEKLDVNGRIKAKGFKNTIYEAGGRGAAIAPYNFIGTNTSAFQDFPGMSVTFSLSEATTVDTSFTLSTLAPSNAFIITRILIDGVVVNNVIAQSFYLSSYNRYITELPAGVHNIQVQYRTNISFNSGDPSDWQSRYLQVLVFGSE